jgi:cytochrome c biogenesis protein CcmG/thiol:disulfide interchange protein DsbE
MNRPVVVLAIAAVVVGIVVVAVTTRFGSDPNAVVSPLVGTPVPALQLPYLEDDGFVNLAAADGEILVVNFWASWCLPCRAEHPVLLDTARRWESAGVRVVGIVYQDDADSASAFLDEFGRGYETVTDAGGRAAISFGVFGIPETFFVDRDGKIAGVVRGAIDSEIVESALQRLVLDTAVTG